MNENQGHPHCHKKLKLVSSLVLQNEQEEEYWLFKNQPLEILCESECLFGNQFFPTRLVFFSFTWGLRPSGSQKIQDQIWIIWNSPLFIIKETNQIISPNIVKMRDFCHHFFREYGRMFWLSRNKPGLDSRFSWEFEDSRTLAFAKRQRKKIIRRICLKTKRAIELFEFKSMNGFTLDTFDIDQEDCKSNT